MKHAGALLGLMMALAACSQGPSADNPYAPGVQKNAEAVDGLVVGNRLMAAQEYDLALEAFSRAALEHGMTAEVLTSLGTANLGLGRLGQAESLLRRALKEDEKSPVIWNNLGVVLMERGKNAEAEQFFRRAYALDNGESDSIRDNLRLALAKLENSEYVGEQEQEYKVVRRGSGEFVIRKIP